MTLTLSFSKGYADEARRRNVYTERRRASRERKEFKKQYEPDGVRALREVPVWLPDKDVEAIEKEKERRAKREEARVANADNGDDSGYYFCEHYCCDDYNDIHRNGEHGDGGGHADDKDDGCNDGSNDGADANAAFFASFCLLFCLWLRGGGSRTFGADERTKFPLRHVLQHNEGLWRLRGVTGSPRHEN